MTTRRIVLAGIGASIAIPAKATPHVEEWIETNPLTTIADLVEEAKRRSGADAKAIEFNILIEMADHA